MNKKLILTGWILFMTLGITLAQPPRGPRISPDEMAQREKQNLYKKVTDLSGDQKLLLDGIYQEFGETASEKFEEIRKTRDREKMRSEMTKLQEEKYQLVSDVLNEEQMKIYDEIVQNQRKRMEERREKSGVGQ
ncbi:MAG: hypothetical protein ABJF11_10115 [Reichenbachiella sp.]|uniref:hypothetical protein n=1 Tax=Reichenbachiella sp. TaxID=2184521 RepID=UPI003267446B